MRRINCSLFLVIAGSAIWVSAWCCWAAEDSTGKPASKPGALDAQFLEGLKPPVSGPPRAVPDPSSAVAEPAADAAPGGANAGEPGTGSDAGPAHPLLRIGARMLGVQQRLRARDLSSATQDTQRQIVEDLNKLIEELAAQEGRTAQRQQASKAAPGKQESQQAGTQAAVDSGKPPGKAEDAGMVNAAPRETLSEVWGHLPERVRRQIQNVRADEFLPQYRQLIEDYYSRLAEERNR